MSPRLGYAQGCPKTSATSVFFSSTPSGRKRGPGTAKHLMSEQMEMWLPLGCCREWTRGTQLPFCHAQCSSAQGDGPRRLEHTGLRQEGVGADVQAVKGRQAFRSYIVQLGREGSPLPLWQWDEKLTFSCVEKQTGEELCSIPQSQGSQEDPAQAPHELHPGFVPRASSFPGL